MAGGSVKIDKSFTYLGVNICDTGTSQHIKKHIAVVQTCMSSLDQSIWRSNITLETLSSLHSVIYGAETWSDTTCDYVIIPWVTW